MHLPLLRSTHRGSLLSCLLLCLLFASGCAALETPTPSLLQSPPLPPTPTLLPGESVPFETILRGRGACPAAHPDNVALVATTTVQIKQFWAEFHVDNRAELPNVDFGRNAVIVAAEACSSDCDDIEVDSVIRPSNGLLYVYAKRRINPPEYGCEAVESASYHFVRIPRDDLAVAETELNLIIFETYE